MNSDPSRSPRSSSPRAADRTGRRRPERRRAPADLLQGLGRVSGEASAAEADRADALALVGSHHGGVVTAVAIACGRMAALDRSEEHTSELQSRGHLVCRLLLEKKKRKLNSHVKMTRHEHDYE